MAPTRELGPWTLHGDLAYPTVTTDRFLREGDVIWVDAGHQLGGLRLRLRADVDHRRRPRPECQAAGAVPPLAGGGRRRVGRFSSLACRRCELGTAAIEANDGVRPWIEHFYLAHGVGTESAEMPLIGTDLGEEFDERLIMQPGMVLVFEPVIWDEGVAGLSIGRHCGRD